MYRRKMIVSIFISCLTACMLACGGEKDSLPDVVSGGDVPQITINGGDAGGYTLADLQAGRLYSDRDYTLAQNLPAKFTGWQAATTQIKAKPGGKIIPSASGKIYMITRFNRAEQMRKQGWQAETPDRETDPDVLLDNARQKLIIWWKQVVAGEKVAIPYAPDAFFGGFTPIAPVVNIAGLTQLEVRGTLIDIRRAAEGNEVYPQHTLTFEKLPSKIDGLNYAVSVKEFAGPVQVKSNTATTLLVAFCGSEVPEGWKNTGDSFGVGELEYQLYSFRYTRPEEWVYLPGKGKASVLLFGQNIRVVDVPPAPGVLIGKVTRLRQDFITNPTLMKLPDESYLATCYGLLGGKGTAMYRSDDGGQTWKVVSSNDGVVINYDKLFWANGALYQIGTSPAASNDIVIRKSRDYGKSWSALATLFSDQEYLAAPTPVVIHEGRVWHAMSTAPENRTKGVVMISAPLESDLLQAGNWTASNVIRWQKEWLTEGDYSFVNWQEGNAVADPEGKMVIVQRVDESNFAKPLHDRAAIVRVKSPAEITFDPQTDIIDFPGGSKKFTIQYDAVSKKYWAITNPCFPEDAGKFHEGIYANGISGSLLRNRLVLISSSDLRHWTQEKVLISSNNPFFHGFQYVDWTFDGEDIIAVCRMAFEESRGLPTRQHDANLFTFHRFSGFRHPASIPTVNIVTEGWE